MKTVLTPVVKRSDVVLLEDVDSVKIYVSRYKHNTYKLSRIPTSIGDRWMFCGLFDSYIGSYGSHKTMKEAIQAELGPVYEFNNAKEFLQWAKV